MGGRTTTPHISRQDRAGGPWAGSSATVKSVRSAAPPSFTGTPVPSVFSGPRARSSRHADQGWPAVSLSGPFAMQGQQTLAGVQAWVDDVNAGGGLCVGNKPPKPVDLVHYDDAGRRDRVKAATERLIADDHVDLLVGPYSAVMTLAAAEVAESHGRLMWNQGGASPNVYRQGNRWVVGVLSPATAYLSELLPAVRHACPDAASLLIARATRGAFPRDVCAGVEERASALGFRIVGIAPVRGGVGGLFRNSRGGREDETGRFCWGRPLSGRPALGEAVGRFGNGSDCGSGRGLRSSPVRGGIGRVG